MTMFSISSSFIHTKKSVVSNCQKVFSRNIAVGTDLLTSSKTWQKARPWHTDDKSSNVAKDNEVTMKTIFQNKKVAVFGIPAPFTGVCTNAHFPPYKTLAHEFKSKGIDEIICFTVADPYSHYNWGRLGIENNFDDITFLVDGASKSNASDDDSWAKEYGLDRDYSKVSLGHRAARFSMIVDNGIVKSFNFVEDASKDAETLLSQV